MIAKGCASRVNTVAFRALPMELRENAFSPMVRTVTGIVISFNFVQLQNAESPMAVSFEGSVTTIKLVQP